MIERCNLHLSKSEKRQIEKQKGVRKLQKNVATLFFNSGGGLIWLRPVDLFVKRGWDQNSMKKKKKKTPTEVK